MMRICRMRWYTLLGTIITASQLRYLEEVYAFPSIQNHDGMKRRFASKNECTSTFSKPSNFGRKRSTIGSIQNGIKTTTCIATRENLNTLYMSTSTRNISRGTAVKGKPSKVEIPYSLYDHQQSVTLDKDETTIPKDDVSENLKNVSSLKGENDNGSQPSSTIQGGTGTGQRQHIIERMRDKLSRTDMRDTAVIMAHASTQIAICKYISIFYCNENQSHMVMARKTHCFVRNGLYPY